MKILLVDDNEINLELQSLMLENYGLNVETAYCGEAAVELVKNGNYSMVFMDIHMPGISGYEAAAQIREFNKDIPILAVSADEIADTDEEFLKSGMNGSLKKPLQLAEIKEKLGSFSEMLSDNKAPEKWRADIIFDYDELLKTLNDEKVIFRVLQQFLGMHKNDCELLKESIENNDFISARQIIHNIKGISGNLVCRQLYTASTRLGNELRQERADSFENYTKVWNQTVAELSECCSKLAEEFKAVKSEVDWDVLWNDFITLCGEFDITATKLFMENTAAFEEHIGAEAFSRLKKAITAYDFISIVDDKEGFDVQSINS